MNEKEAVALAPKIMQDISRRAGKYLGLVDTVILHPTIDPIKFPTLENACESAEGTIYINSNWLLEMLVTENFTELRRLLYHEFRHQYQIQEVIKLKSKLESNESTQTLKSWEQDIENTIRNDNAGNRTQYFLQTVEIDAEAFALHLLDRDKEDGFNVQLTHEVPKEAEEPIIRRKRDIDRYYS